MLTRTVKRYTEMKPATISGVCRLLGISRQKYYRSGWSEKRSRERATQVVSMVQEVRAIMPRIGARKLHFMLGDGLKGIGVGRDRLLDILRANHMLVLPCRNYHVTTNSHHRFRKHKNLVAGLELVRPEQVWVSDITYVGSRSNNMYLSLVTDAYSKKIVGYNLSKSLDTEGSLKALRMACRNRRYPGEPLIHHSDRGIQYCSDAYQKCLEKHGIRPSMTESYDPYANAVAERVNGILKQEFLIEDLNLPFELMKKAIADCIHLYNNMRPHFSCGYMTPEWMHSQRSMPIKTYKKKPPQEKLAAVT